jgi:hypothetical protein
MVAKRTDTSVRTVGEYVDVYEGLDRVTVAEAARRLGVKEQAIRKRIARGTLQHDKAQDGRVYVYVDAESEDEVQGIDTRNDTYRDALVESLQDQNRFLREELARKDAILMNMTETMRQLTAPPDDSREEAPESPEPRSDRSIPTDRDHDQETPSERPKERSWWRRMFGGS